MQNFIEISHLSYSYPMRDGRSVAAIQDLNASIQPGEFTAIIGPNGSGKSTLGKLLNALLLPDFGDVTISGMNTKEPFNLPKIRSLVGMVFQRPQDQIVATTVSEDVAFGPGNLGLPSGEIRKRVENSLNVTGLNGFDNRPSYMLSAGETQRLALAGILAMQPACIIFDETTAMLDPAGREMVMRQAKSLQQQGMTIIFITHLMDEAAQSDRVLVMFEGRLAMDGSPREVFANEKTLSEYGLKQPDVTELANALHAIIPEIPTGILEETDLFQAIPEYKNKNIEFPKKVNNPGKPKDVIRVEDLSHTYLRGTVLAHQSLNQVGFAVSQNSAQGLIGSTGSGKSTLLQHLNALIHPQSGKVEVLGQDLTRDDLNVKELRSRVGLIFQQPENQIFEQFVGDEVAFAARNFGVQGKISDIVRGAMESVGLDFNGYKDRYTSTLSGGEQRKVALASVLAGSPEILLLDEPLAGLDPRSRKEISKYLLSQKENGKTLVISTHQFDDLMDIMDGINILAHGSNYLQGESWRVFNQRDQLKAAGIRPPLGITAAASFRKKGWPIPMVLVSSDELVRVIKTILGGAENE